MSTETVRSERALSALTRTWAAGPPGVATDFARDAIEAGCQVHVFASGATFLVDHESGASAPIVCGEIVPWATEDGPSTSRCGLPVLHDDVACPGHAAEIRRWRDLSELERAAWEREQEGVR